MAVIRFAIAAGTPATATHDTLDTAEAGIVRGIYVDGEEVSIDHELYYRPGATTNEPGPFLLTPGTWLPVTARIENHGPAAELIIEVRAINHFFVNASTTPGTPHQGALAAGQGGFIQELFEGGRRVGAIEQAEFWFGTPGSSTGPFPLALGTPIPDGANIDNYGDKIDIVINSA